MDFSHRDIPSADIETEIRENPQPQERVSARMNLNSKAIIVKRRNSEFGTYGNTILQTPGPVVLTDVEFRVQDKAHEKVAEQGSRDVCAYALGKIAVPAPHTSAAAHHNLAVMAADQGEPIRYNPFRSKYFTRLEGEDHVPVESASTLVLWSEQTEDGIKGRMLALRSKAYTEAI